MDMRNKSQLYRNHLVLNLSSPPVLNLLLSGDRQPEKRRLKPLVFLDVIFWAFLSGKVGHLLRER